MKLVQLVFVLNNINLSTLLVGKKKPRLGPFQPLSNTTDYGCAYGAVIEPARRTQRCSFQCSPKEEQGVTSSWGVKRW